MDDSHDVEEFDVDEALEEVRRHERAMMEWYNPRGTTEV